MACKFQPGRNSQLHLAGQEPHAAGGDMRREMPSPFLDSDSVAAMQM